MVRDFLCVSEGDLTVGEPGVFGFVAYEGDDGVFVLHVFVYRKKEERKVNISDILFNGFVC